MAMRSPVSSALKSLVSRTDIENTQQDRSRMNHRMSYWIENVSEATVACLLTMAQGNVLAIGASHLIIASQTGIAAGTAATIAILFSKQEKRGLIATILGSITTVVDYLVHPGMFGPVFAEAIVTGVGAALLSYAVSTLISKFRSRRVAA